MANETLNDRAADFLERDFNQCFGQMRHYDNQILSIVKFTFTAYSALIAVAVGLYQFSQTENVDLVPVGIAILAVGYLFGTFMFSLIVRNRVYFVIVARYVNEHRRLFLAVKPLGFENETGMYTSTSFPQYFNWRSSQAFYLYLVALLNSILLFALLGIKTSPYLAIAGLVISLVGHLGLAIRYLVTREGKSSGEAAFGSSGE